MKRFLLRSGIPTSLVVAAYTFFSLIAVHRMALLWCMEHGDNLVHPPLPIQREHASRVLHYSCGVLYFPLHDWQQGKKISLITTIRERYGVIRLEYMDTIFGSFVLLKKNGHLRHKHIFCQYSLLPNVPLKDAEENQYL